MRVRVNDVTATPYPTESCVVPICFASTPESGSMKALLDRFLQSTEPTMKESESCVWVDSMIGNKQAIGPIMNQAGCDQATGTALHGCGGKEHGGICDISVVDGPSTWSIGTEHGAGYRPSGRRPNDEPCS